MRFNVKERSARNVRASLRILKKRRITKLIPPTKGTEALFFFRCQFGLLHVKETPDSKWMQMEMAALEVVTRVRNTLGSLNAD